MKISAVDYYLPSRRLTNADLAASFPEWSVEKIASKTGIESRRIAGEDEYSSDLGFEAAEVLFASSGFDRNSIEYLIVCSQTPDFVLPSLASTIQHRLGLRTGIGAVDINLGCSGYVYGLGLAKGLIESGQASAVLLVTADTYSKLLNPADKTVRTIFGDGASATLIESGAPDDGFAVVYGTDGGGAKSLIVPEGGLRAASTVYTGVSADERALQRTGYDLYMDGPEVFNFTLRVVPDALAQVLDRAGVGLEEIDLFIFHQANAFMLEHLRKKIGIAKDRFYISLAETGNTVSSTIPIALANAERDGTLREGMRVLLLGFGVGLSWGGLVIQW